VPGHFTTLWKWRSTSTPSGQLASEAVEYIYSTWAESVKVHFGLSYSRSPPPLQDLLRSIIYNSDLPHHLPTVPCLSQCLLHCNFYCKPMLWIWHSVAYLFLFKSKHRHHYFLVLSVHIIQQLCPDCFETVTNKFTGLFGYNVVNRVSKSVHTFSSLLMFTCFDYFHNC
jgi:hypothetical protein